MRVTVPGPVAFLGAGLMGKPMALRLIQAGFEVTAWNRTESKLADLLAAGAKTAPHPAEAVREARAVILMLDNGPVVDQVLLGSGVADASQPGTLVVDMSSIAPEFARRHARELTARNLRYLDAPVSGGTVGAANGTLAIMAGGNAEDVHDARPLLAPLGTVVHVGRHGSGQLAKLVNQCIVAVTIGAVAEGLVLAKEGGADPSQVRKAIMNGFCRSRILELHGQRMLDRDFVPGGLVKHQIKDLDAVAHVADETGLELPLTRAVRDLFVALAKRGYENQDHSALILEVEERRRPAALDGSGAGLDLPSPGGAMR